MSPAVLSVELIAWLAHEIPQLRYAKIERPQTAEKLRAVIGASGEDLQGPFDGEESITLIPDLDAGAIGTMSSCMVPDELGRIVRKYRAGDRAGALDRW